MFDTWDGTWAGRVFTILPFFLALWLVPYFLWFQPKPQPLDQNRANGCFSATRAPLLKIQNGLANFDQPDLPTMSAQIVNGNRGDYLQTGRWLETSLDSNGQILFKVEKNGGMNNDIFPRAAMRNEKTGRINKIWLGVDDIPYTRVADDQCGDIESTDIEQQES